MLSPCRRLRFLLGHFAFALAADHSISISTTPTTSDSDQDPDWQLPTASPHLRCCMRVAATDGDLDAALEALGRLQPAPAAPNYNTLLHTYLRSGGPTLGHVAAVISHKRRLGPTPNALTFNTAFNWLLWLGHLDAVHDVLEEMWSSCGFVPSFTAVDKLVKKAAGLLADSALANAIVSVLVKSVGADVAYEVFLILVNRGFGPNVYMYNQILFGLCKFGGSSKALALLCNLRKRGLSLNVYSYTALVFGFCKEKLWGEAYSALVMMCHEGCEPSVVTYAVVANFLCKDMKTDDAMLVFRMAYEQGCHRDITICNVLLHALCCADRVLEAPMIIDVMEEAGFVPDRLTIFGLAAGFLKTGHVKTCQNFVQRVFTKSNVSMLSLGIYTSIAYAAMAK